MKTVVMRETGELVLPREILHITRGFDENDLYDNLAWLADNQVTIERRFIGRYF